MDLLDAIIEDATLSRGSVADLLRRCLVLAYKLNNSSLKEWVENELNGYPNADGLPDYRLSKGVAKGLFLGSYGSELRDQPLAASVLKPEHRHWATDIKLVQPIISYEQVTGTGTAVILWPQDLVALYQRGFYEGMALNRAWMEVPKSLMSGIVDVVRTRVLMFALELRSKYPQAQDKIENIPASTVENIFQITINGGNNVIGNVREINAITVLAGDIKSLRALLASLGIGAADIDTIESELIGQSAPKGSNPSSLKWAQDAARRMANSALKVGSA
ncbi:MAG: hypothetical protein AB7F36_15420, partial [Reyranellaceae bacterium]